MTSYYPLRTTGATLWLMGSLANKPLSLVLLAGFIILLCFLAVRSRWQELNLLSLGDELALTGGVDIGFYRKFFLFMATVMTGVVVSLTGIIGFVGIIIPHIARMMIGADHRHLLLTSSLGGAFFLLGADTVLRLLFEGVDLPVGVVTALAGAPFFIWILFRQGRSV
jgi:iron complex transport system permease protein